MNDAPAKGWAIETDVVCRSCGYNLRGLKTDGICPECGLHIQDSLRFRDLRGLDIRWLGRVEVGLSLVIGGILGASVGCVAALISMTANGSVLPITPAFIGLALVGVYLATGPTPGVDFDTRVRRVRKAARGLSLALMAILMLYLGTSLAAAQARAALRFGIILAASLPAAILAYSLARWIEEIVRRDSGKRGLRNVELARQLAPPIVLCAGIVAAFGVYGWKTALHLMACLFLPALIGVPIAAGCMIIALGQTCRVVSEAAGEANSLAGKGGE